MTAVAVRTFYSFYALLTVWRLNDTYFGNTTLCQCIHAVILCKGDLPGGEKLWIT